MASNLSSRLSGLTHSRRLRRAAAWSVGLVAAFGLFGFFAAPPLLKSLLEKKLAEALHRPVGIERIAINPYALSAEVDGLTVRDEEGKEVFGFAALHANLEAASLLQGGLVLRELRLDGPRLQLTRIGGDRYDISDLIDEWSKPSDSPTPLFSVSNIQIGGGKLTLIDQPKHSTHTVEDLALRLPFISSLPYQSDIFVEPYFSARINGAPLVLEGRSKPFAESHESELSIDLDRVELARYVPYSPVALPFAVRGGSLDSELKLVFRQAAGQPATLQVVGALHLSDLTLAESGGTPLLALKRLDVDLREADLVQRRFAVDRVRLAGFEANARMRRDGRLNWQELAARLGGAPAAGPARGAPKAAPLAWEIKEILVEDGVLRYRDEQLPDLPVQVLDRIDLRLGGLSGDAGSKLALALDARINARGSLKSAGEVRLEPLAVSLDLDFSGLPLLPAQPYFGERLNLVLSSGQLSGQGKLDLQAGADGLGGGFQGQLTLGDLASVDKANRADFLKWRSLFIGNIDARLQPLALSVGEVALSDFYARVILNREGRLNLAQIVRQPEAPPPPPAEPVKSAAGRATAVVPPKPEREVLPISIGKVSLQGGTVNFSDHFVKPNYTVNVTRIAGRINGLSSAAGTLADLELRGSYGSAAPVQVLAKLNPLAAKTYLDLKGEIRGVDLTTLSTYAGKYAGYAIDQGKLSLYVSYHLDNNQLTADNRVFLDQLTFGNRVDSPDATSLPVKLAVALLKNGRGEIDLNLPVSGSLDDPQFSIGGVILRLIGNLFVKAVTSPFALLGSLFGGGEELSAIDFDSGRASLGATAIKRLDALARAMNDRPALKLEIAGRVDPETDREGLKRAAVERAVKIEKQKELIKKGVASGAADGIEIGPTEYPVYLQRAYREAKFPKPRNLIGMHKDLPLEEMEKLMLANLAVGDDDLRLLAARRAEAAQAWLIEQGKVPVERLFLLPPKLGGEAAGNGKAGPSRVDFSLR